MLGMSSLEVYNKLFGPSHIEEEIVVLATLDKLAHLIPVGFIVNDEAHHSSIICNIIPTPAAGE